MNWLRSRRGQRFLARARRWQREREARLQAEVLILETLLATTRQELADIRQLEGEKLALMYGSLKPEDMQEGQRESKAFAEQLASIFLAGEHNLKSKQMWRIDNEATSTR